MDLSFDVQKVQEDAEAYFQRGNYYCSEAIVASVRDNIAPDMPEALIAAASGFPVGVGRSKCMCGAVSGGVISLGYVFGRTGPSSPADPKSVKTLELAERAPAGLPRQPPRAVLQRPDQGDGHGERRAQGPVRRVHGRDGRQDRRDHRARARASRRGGGLTMSFIRRIPIPHVGSRAGRRPDSATCCCRTRRGPRRLRRWSRLWPSSARRARASPSTSRACAPSSEPGIACRAPGAVHGAHAAGHLPQAASPRVPPWRCGSPRSRSSSSSSRLFVARFVASFKLAQVLPAWFLVFVGFVVASVTSPAFGMQPVGTGPALRGAARVRPGRCR